MFRPPPLLKETIQFTPPVVTEEEVNEEDMMLTQKELTDSKVDISVVTVESGSKDGVDIADLANNQVIVQAEPENKVLDFAEQMPRYPDGDAALYKWLNDNMVYPPIAVERGTQGTVVLKFVVLPNGSVGDVVIVRGVDKDLDKEAQRVVKKLPKFIPGRQNGQAVSVWFTLPVRFQLK
ncbi:energy transducer TonB [Bacteroidales bacterium OttesenSCG-928-M11]|nr:energy transducer TonB [Bacteroidales bacterium OttesenSCG-928-M11]